MFEHVVVRLYKKGTRGSACALQADMASDTLVTDGVLVEGACVARVLELAEELDDEWEEGEEEEGADGVDEECESEDVGDADTVVPTSQVASGKISPLRRLSGDG